MSRRRDTQSPEAIPSCPVEALGQRIAMLNREYDKLAARKLSVPDGELRLAAERRQTELHDRVEALQAAATCERATSPGGALFHLMLALSAAEDLLALDLPEDVLAQSGRALRRCLYSAAGLLVRTHGLDPAQLGGDFYMPEDADPWRAE